MKPLLALAAFSTLSGAAELKIYLLAGQSNAEGQAEVATTNKTTGAFLNGTLAYQLTDPRTAASFASLWDAGRKNWTVWPTAKMWYNEIGPQSGVNGSAIPSNSSEACFGDLSVGFGSCCVRFGARAHSRPPPPRPPREP